MTFTYSPYLLPFFAWLFSISGTWVALLLLKRYCILDTPNARSNHALPVPRGGGIAMVISAVWFLLAAGINPLVAASCLLLAIISFADDMRGLPVRIRLFTQIIAVALAMYTLPGRLLPDAIPLFIEWILIALAWIWFINLTNFMDGIDGITSMQTILVTVGIAFISQTLKIPSCIVAAATLGFYWFNRPPAKLFMGDVGSIVLGFLTGYLLLRLAIEGHLVAALILPAYYLCDATSTLLKRAYHKEKIWEAHSKHAYQQAVRAGFSHAKTVRMITFLNIILVVLAILSTLHMIAGIVMLILAYTLTACLLYYFTHVHYTR